MNDRWSIRRLERYARDVVGRGGHVLKSSGPGGGRAEGSNVAAAPSRGAAAAPAMAAALASPFRRSDGGLFIDTNRIARREVSPEEREELTKLLEDVLTAVRRAL